MAEKLKPKTLESCSNQKPTKTPLLSDNLMQKNLKKWPIKVNFPGCRKPHQNWSNWVEKLSLKYAEIWELTGICDGILSSLHQINLNPEIVLPLSEFWCSETNTFVFPWGEATITLEDVNVLFGLPVLGKSVCVSSFDEGSSDNLEQKLHQVKNSMTVCSCELDAWINYFNAENDEVEHVGFLAFWLSMFVFPDVIDRTIGSHVFSTAVGLARGAKIALAPAVLACLYKDLTFLTQNAADFDPAKKEVSVPAPFQIVQLWGLERFPWLGLKLAKTLRLGHPRIARWDSVSCKANLVDVRRSLRSSGDSFCWRPYALDLENSRHKSFYLDHKEKILLLCEFSGGDDIDDELKSFRICLQPQELIGIDCTAVYQPQRVMQQFGCDQKVPSHNQLSKESMRDHENTVSIGVKQEPENEDDDKKQILASKTLKTEQNDEAEDASPGSEYEVLNVVVNDNGNKQNSCERNIDELELQNMENMMVVLDSDDDELEEKLRCNDVVIIQSRRSNTNYSKRRHGDSADYPLYINEYSRKIVKKSGVSFANAIDVENY